jgi:hypothetical protein
VLHDNKQIKSISVTKPAGHGLEENAVQLAQKMNWTSATPGRPFDFEIGFNFY